MNEGPMTSQKRQSYYSYLLRLWQETDNRQPQWRASVESAQTGETYRFASLEALIAFLRRQAVSATALYQEECRPDGQD
jgi:hypothetical protein